MREIKFRAIPFEWNQFIYGSYVGYKDTHYIYAEMYERATHIGILSQVQIDKSTLGQYTGLKDKNNQEIYEGDIVSFPSNLNDFYSIMRQDFNEPVHSIVVAEIRFDNGGFTFDYQFGYEGREVDWKDIEVIGNIHENPELLENKE